MRYTRLNMAFRTLPHLTGIGLFITLCFWTSVIAATETEAASARLTLSGLEQGQQVSQHDLGILRFDVRFEHQLATDRPLAMFDAEKLEVRVNDRAINHRRMASGGGNENNFIYWLNTITLRPGAPGSKKISVRYGDLEAGITIDWQPGGQLELLDLVEGQAIFGKQTTTVRWIGALVQPKSVKLSVNGKTHPVKKTTAPSSNMYAGRQDNILSPGINRIELTARDLLGQRVNSSTTVYYFPDNQVPQGTIFALPMGPMGSRSGPFFRSKILWPTIRKLDADDTHPNSSDPLLERVEQGGLLMRRRPLELAWFKAMTQGKAIIRVEKKQYFQDSQWLPEQTISMQITGKKAR